MIGVSSLATFHSADGHGHGDKKKSQSSPKSGSGRASTKSADDDVRLCI